MLLNSTEPNEKQKEEIQGRRKHRKLLGGGGSIAQPRAYRAATTNPFLYPSPTGSAFTRRLSFKHNIADRTLRLLLILRACLVLE